MASAYIFATKINPRGNYDFTITATGGTITGASGKVELVYDTTAFTGAEGKARLLLALEQMKDKLERADVPWPAS